MPGIAGLAALILAPIVWSAHFLAVYVAAALVCERGGSVGLIPPLTVGMTVVAGAAMALLAVAACRRSAEAQAAERRHFIRNVALLVIAISALGLAWNTLPGVMTPGCG